MLIFLVRFLFLKVNIINRIEKKERFTVHFSVHNENFLMQLNFYTSDNKFNYLAYLLSDNNNISIKVASYQGEDSYNLIQNEEYGYCCLIKSTKKVLDKFNMINKTYTTITNIERKEIKKLDAVALREAIINAFVHNSWVLNNPPKFEIFSDHISITSTGGLINKINEEEFLKRYSFPRNPELMRIYRDLDLVEQLGTGVLRIIKAHDKNVFEFSENFIRVNFKYNKYKSLFFENNKNLTITQNKIMSLIKQNNKITQKEMIEITNLTRTTITKNLLNLKEKNIIKRVGPDKGGYWEIIDECETNIKS